MDTKQFRRCQLCRQEALCKYLLIGMYAVDKSWVCKPCRLKADAEAHPGFKATLRDIWRTLTGSVKL
jgi:hypothetical protein